MKHLRSPILVLLILCAPLAGAMSASGSVVIASQQSSVAGAGLPSTSPDEAVDQRARALERLAELQRLDESPVVSVDQSTITTVRTRIEQGNISYSRANYDNASEHWQVAREQARSALNRHYNLGAHRYLNATIDYLDAREAAGYNSAEMSQFRQQARQIRVENASGLQETRNRYQTAKDLNSTVESELPPMQTVRWANRLTPLRMSAAVVTGALLALLSIAGYLGYLRGKGQTPDSADNDDDGDTETTETPSPLR
ncbi:hypothetical protein [Haloarcula brevis]|uniref:hypothetical protein n=1 Tax=Haloarcula brevis TaxID=3111453 RepID=UPI00300F6A52